jgi:hypothetical protein
VVGKLLLDSLATRKQLKGAPAPRPACQTLQPSLRGSPWTTTSIPIPKLHNTKRVNGNVSSTILTVATSPRTSPSRPPTQAPRQSPTPLRPLKPSSPRHQTAMDRPPFHAIRDRPPGKRAWPKRSNMQDTGARLAGSSGRE